MAPPESPSAAPSEAPPDALPHTRILAVDPGLSGALAHLSVSEVVDATNAPHYTLTLHGVVDTPLLRSRRGRPAPNLPALAGCVADAGARGATLAVIEDVHGAPGQGGPAMFRFGYLTGLVCGAATAAGLDVTRPTPQTWQRWARLRRIDARGRSRPTKTAALERALVLWPDAEHLFRRKGDHGRADAALIGYAYFSKQLQLLPSTAFDPEKNLAAPC